MRLLAVPTLALAIGSLVPTSHLARAESSDDPAGAVFSPDAVQPYFATGIGAIALNHFTLGRTQEAREAFAKLRSSSDMNKKAELRARVDFLLAICDLRLGHYAEAAAGFDAAGQVITSLADYANYDAAFAYFWSKEYDKAAERLSKVSSDSVLDEERRLLTADVLRSQQKWPALVELYENHLMTYPKGIRQAERRFRLAQAYEMVDRAIPDALRLYREIMIDAPLESWAAEAKKRFDQLLQKVPKHKRAEYTELTAEEHLERAHVLFDAMRNPESEAEFIAALKGKGLDAGAECDARYYRAQSVFKQRQRSRSAPLFDEATATCEKTKNTDLQVRSVYQAARGWGSLGENGENKAITRFERAEKWHPEHSFADDARLRQAEIWERRAERQVANATDKVTELLSKMPQLFPNGDMKGEALWRLAWRAYKAKDYETAISWLDKQIAAIPHEDHYWAEGQAYYWRARAYDQLGMGDQARGSYEQCVHMYPLSYYALLALNRIREQYPKLLERLLGNLRQLPAGWQVGSPALQFAPRAMYGEPGFERAIELLRMGLGQEAARELTRLGLKVPTQKSKVSDPDKAEQLWATALLYDRGHRYDKSHWITRWAVLDYRQAWPTDANRLRWEIAYPKAWWHLVEPAAKEQGYVPELLESFVREESAFDPQMESFANAIGLTQMIFPTANRFGKGLGFEITRENLVDPEKNVAIGSRFLAFLWKTFSGRVGLLVPAYNAGEGAVWRWLCERGSWKQDEFAEEIPFDETRNYAKRVISSYFAYAYLSDGTVPTMPNDVPSGVINKSKCKDKAESPPEPAGEEN